MYRIFRPDIYCVNVSRWNRYEMRMGECVEGITQIIEGVNLSLRYMCSFSLSLLAGASIRCPYCRHEVNIRKLIAGHVV